MISEKKCQSKKQLQKQEQDVPIPVRPVYFAQRGVEGYTTGGFNILLDKSITEKNINRKEQ